MFLKHSSLIYLKLCINNYAMNFQPNVVTVLQHPNILNDAELFCLYFLDSMKTVFE